MKRMKFIEELIGSVDLSRPNKDEIVAELTEKINDFMCSENSSGDQEADYNDDEEDEQDYFISSLYDDEDEYDDEEYNEEEEEDEQ